MERIQEAGGDGLVKKFLSDPEMLDPEVVGGFLEGGENPYSKYMKKGHVGPTSGGTQEGVLPQGGGQINSIEGITGRISELYRPQNREYLRSEQGGQEMLQLVHAKKSLTGGNFFG